MLTAVAAVVVVAFSVATARLFVWPGLPPVPARADAVVQLGGPGDRRDAALGLVRQGRAPLVAISVSDKEADTSWCDAGRLHDVPVICFHSTPFTTRGEARDVARLAGRYGWSSVILVTSPDQATRAIRRVSQCFPGRISVVTVRLLWYQWPWQIAYQWAATIKAYTYQTSC